MEIVKAAALGFLVCLLSLLLKKSQPALAILLVLAGNIAVLTLVMRAFSPLLQWLQSMSALISDESFACLLKALGIAVIAQFSQDLCRDAGTQSLATSIELGARILVIVAALPLIQNILEVLTGWLL